MKNFRCTHCRSVVFFENTSCAACGSELAYDPRTREMVALALRAPDTLGAAAAERDASPAGASLDGASHAGARHVWTEPDAVRALADGTGTVRLCANVVRHAACNWLAHGDEPYCESCRLTRTIPDLSVPGNLEAWRAVESAKRRLVYTLHALALPMPNKRDEPESGLVFDFLQGHVLTGHAAGVITVNIAEADPVERERRRIELGEGYRTLLGHLRHESGHYYWERLVRDGGRLDAWRRRFGDERAPYDESLARHRQFGAPPDWPTTHISAYATSHPWEDWAESWAHYLAMIDLLESAHAGGLAVASVPGGAGPGRFDAMLRAWTPLTVVLNNLNRSLGQPDAYPFAPPDAAIGKLAFIDAMLAAVQSRRAA